jgi:hypothetical protein
VKMERVFGITPASSGPYIFIWAISVVLIAVIVLFIFIGHSSRNMTFTVNDEGLRIRGGFYGRMIPKSDILAEEVRVMNLDMETDYKPKWRTNGIGLPGYAAGWFKLQNKEKALLFVTDRSRVVYIPTSKDYSVMLSTTEAEELAGLLKQWN